MAAHDSLTPVVMDNGTGLTKMGYADMSQPQYTIPTCIGLPLPQRAQSRQDGLHDLDFYVGEEAKLHTRDYGLSYPIEKGVVTNWDHMEKLWQRCFFKYLKCEPESHCVLLTEPPLNAPENRELVAEIMFETFNVPGLYIAVSAVLALTAAWEANLAKLSQRKTPEELRAYKDEFGFRERTGAVVDSGHGLTNVVPVYEGYVVGSSIRKVPLAGNDVTEFIKQLLKDRREPVPPEELTDAATRIKEEHCYICKDIVKEFQTYDKEPVTSFKLLSGMQRRTKEPWQCNVGYERFLGPEVFFQPEIFNPAISTPLATVVDEAILAAPTDCRRKLYNNIVLAGGSTMFKAFGKRLERDIKKRVTARYNRNLELYNITREEDKPKKLDVSVESTTTQKYAAWFGGSCLAADPAFKDACHSRAHYMEHGARIVRSTQGFA